MAKKRTKDHQTEARLITLERAARLYRLLQMLDKKPQTRPALAKRLRLDLRGFYRDLEFLRSAGIALPLSEGRYRLEKKLRELLPRIPFPDPGLTLSEAMQLAKGRSPAHAKLRNQIARITRQRV
jgi:predicted DNA-binding transcriptional regulator YafY